MWVVKRTLSPSHGCGSASLPGSLHESLAMRPSMTRSSTSRAFKLDGKKSPCIHPGGTVARAVEGFFPLLDFFGAMICNEELRSGRRGGGEKKRERRGKDRHTVRNLPPARLLSLPSQVAGVWGRHISAHPTNSGRTVRGEKGGAEI